MIYGDNPQQIGEYKDALGLSRYAYAPQRAAITQAGNLYVYCGNNPLMFIDPTGCEWYHWLIGGGIVAAAAVAVVVTAGGALPAVYAVGAVASGVSAGFLDATIAASAFIGASAVFGYSLIIADYSSIESFNASADWKTVAFTTGGLLAGGAAGVIIYQNSDISIAGKGHSHGRIEANNLNDQLAMKEVLSNPLKDAKQLTNITMNDPRWLAEDGWVKMEWRKRLSDGSEIVIHYVFNTITGLFDDFKFND